MATILLVDDERLIRRSVGRLLSRRHTVLTAASGEEALEILDDQAVDVILTDIMMPGIGGAGLYARLSLQLRQRVILMTGTVDDVDVQNFIQLVSAPLLLKPFFLHELQEAVGKVLRSSSAARL